MDEEIFEIKIEGGIKEVPLSSIGEKIELKINEITGSTEDSSLESLEELGSSQLDELDELEPDLEDDLLEEDDFEFNDTDDFELDDFDILD